MPHLSYRVELDDSRLEKLVAWVKLGLTFLPPRAAEIMVRAAFRAAPHCIEARIVDAREA